MKFTEGLFAIDKNYEAVLRNKITRYMDFTKRRKSLQLVLITAFGLSRNIYSNIVSKTLVLDDKEIHILYKSSRNGNSGV